MWCCVFPFIIYKMFTYVWQERKVHTLRSDLVNWLWYWGIPSLETTLKLAWWVKSKNCPGWICNSLVIDSFFIFQLLSSWISFFQRAFLIFSAHWLFLPNLSLELSCQDFFSFWHNILLHFMCNLFKVSLFFSRYRQSHQVICVVSTHWTLWDMLTEWRSSVQTVRQRPVKYSMTRCLSSKLSCHLIIVTSFYSKLLMWVYYSVQV